MKESICAPSEDKWHLESKWNAQSENNILQEDVVYHSSLTAACVVKEKETNGWAAWKNAESKCESY